jgi:hypothetical protein
MDLKEIFEAKANEWGWRWSYGNSNNHNLLSVGLDASEIYFLMDSPNRTQNINQYGGVEGTNYSGQLLLAMQSNFDDVYDTQRDAERGRYEKHIKPLIEEKSLELVSAIVCFDNYRITRWIISERINAYNANLDGIVIDYTIEEL